MTMMQVIWLGGSGDPYQIGAHFVATLLNIQSHIINVLDKQKLFSIWLSYVNTGGYNVPNTNIVWSPSQIVDYLKSTMPI